jgi:hypothetical protein
VITLGIKYLQTNFLAHNLGITRYFIMIIQRTLFNLEAGQNLK